MASVELGNASDGEVAIRRSPLLPDGNLNARLQPETSGRWPILDINFNPASSSMILDVGYLNLAEAIVGEEGIQELAGHGFVRTAKPHITVLGYPTGDNIKKKIGHYSPVGQSIILRTIENAAKRHEWQWRPTGELHPFIGRNHGILKLIAGVECPDVEEFYDEVQEIIPGVEIEQYPMHITLLKRQMGVEVPYEGRLGSIQLGDIVFGLNRLPADVGQDTATVADVKAEAAVPLHVRQIVNKRLRLEIDPKKLHLHDWEGLNNPLYSAMPPPPELLGRIAADFDRIDTLAAAAFGRRVALVPESLQHFVPGAIKPISVDFSPVELASFFDEQMESALQALNSPQILPQSVITGAIAKLAYIFNNQRLHQELERRAAEDPTYYPVRIPTFGFLRQLSSELLKQLESEETQAT